MREGLELFFVLDTENERERYRIRRTLTKQRKGRSEKEERRKKKLIYLARVEHAVLVRVEVVEGFLDLLARRGVLPTREALVNHVVHLIVVVVIVLLLSLFFGERA